MACFGKSLQSRLSKHSIYITGKISIRSGYQLIIQMGTLVIWTREQIVLQIMQIALLPWKKKKKWDQMLKTNTYFVSLLAYMEVYKIPVSCIFLSDKQMS